VIAPNPVASRTPAVNHSHPPPNAADQQQQQNQTDVTTDLENLAATRGRKGTRHHTVRRFGELERDAAEVGGTDEAPGERELPRLPQGLELRKPHL